MILAGDEFATPDDFPSNRLDSAGAVSVYNAVGGLEITSGSSTYSGSGVALSQHWVLTAGHNVDLDSDGAVDSGVSFSYHLPGLGSYAVDQVHVLSSFSGFANPAVNDDLALLHLSTPMSSSLHFPSSILGGSAGMEITLVGFGRSGFGSYGYTSDATFTDRRVGWNVIDGFESDDDGGLFNEVFLYDFDAPTDVGSLGNDHESIIGPGDSGGPAFAMQDGELALVGINTFTEGLGGRFGDTAGGILVDPYLPWIRETTGLYQVPEPSGVMFLVVSLVVLLRNRNRRA